MEITDIKCLIKEDSSVEYQVTLDHGIKFSAFFDIVTRSGRKYDVVYSNIGSGESYEAVFDFPHKGSRISAIEKIIKHIEGRLETNVNF